MSKGEPEVVVNEAFEVEVEEMKESIPWQKAERLAKDDLKKMFPKMNFEKKKLKVGEAEKEFDLVSEDNKIIVQVKSSSHRENGDKRPTQLKRTGYDLFLLDRRDADRKMLYIANDDFYDDFRKFFKGMIPNSIEIRKL